MNGGFDELPSSPILCGWLRRLAPFNAACLRLVRFSVVDLECLVRTSAVNTLTTLERLALLLVRANSANNSAANWGQRPASATDHADQFASRYGLPVVLGRAIWRELTAAGLLTEEPGGAVQLTPAGVAALSEGVYTQTQFKRASFVFARRGHSSVVEFLTQSPAVRQYAEPADPPIDWQVDADTLRECIGRTDSWKREAGFPTEVKAVVTLGEDNPHVPDWQRAVLAQPRTLTAAVFDTPNGVRGYAVATHGWTLHPEPVAFEFSTSHAQRLPGLIHQLSVELWRESAERWCANEGLACVDVQVDVSGPGLRLSVSPAVRARLQALVGLGHWLWAGDAIGCEARLVEWEPSQPS